jgi:hypothetical protein
MDPMSQMHQWLTKKELEHGIKDHETAQLFVDNHIELKRLADVIRNRDPIAESRVELMSEGEVLGTALIAWLRETEDEIGVARKVVEVVWPRTCAGWAQIHTQWTISCETKLDLIQEMESWVRKHSARCERHLIKLGYHCLRCQHGLCTACNEIEGRIQCPWCLEPFPIMPHGLQQPAHNHTRTTQCLNLHALGEQWIEEVTDVDIVQTPPEECLEGEHLKFKADIRGEGTLPKPVGKT